LAGTSQTGANTAIFDGQVVVQEMRTTASQRDDSLGNRVGTALALLATRRKMFRFKPAQRRVLVDKVPDFANIGAGAFVFSQFIGEQPASFRLLAIGLALWAGVMVVVVMIAGGEHHD
jgi:hypothetical protein